MKQIQTANRYLYNGARNMRRKMFHSDGPFMLLVLPKKINEIYTSIIPTVAYNAAGLRPFYTLPLFYLSNTIREYNKELQFTNTVV